MTGYVYMFNKSQWVDFVELADVINKICYNINKNAEVKKHYYHKIKIVPN